MSLVLWIIILIALVVVFVLALRLLEGAAKIIIVLAVAAFVLLGVVWTITDVNDVRAHFLQDDKLFLLDIDGTLAAGFMLGGDGTPEPIANMSRMRTWYPDVGAIKGSAYKVVVIDWPAVARTLKVDGLTATDAELRDALLSDTPKRLLITKLADQHGKEAVPLIRQQVDLDYPTQDLFRSKVFVQLAEPLLGEPKQFLAQLKLGMVRVLPETVTFKILKLLPASMSASLLPAETEVSVDQPTSAAKSALPQQTEQGEVAAID